MKLLRLFKNTTFRTFALSYILLIAFFIVLSFPATYYNNKKISNQMQKSNRLILSEQSLKFETRLSALDSASTSTLYNTEFTNLSAMFSQGNFSYTRAHNVISLLSSIQKAISPDVKVAVYFKSFDKVISQTGTYSSSDFFKAEYSSDDNLYSLWKSFLSSAQNAHYLLCSNSDSQQTQFLFSSNVKPVNHDIVVFSYISLQPILSTMDNFRTSVGHELVLINKKDNITVSNEPVSEKTKKLVEHSSPSKDVLSVNFAGGWTCFLLLDNNIMSNAVISTWLFNTLTILIASILSILMGLLFSKRHYLPIYKLRENLVGVSDQNLKGNDFDLISAKISELLNTLETASRKNNDFTQINSLRNAIFNKCSSDDVKMLKNVFANDEFCVALISADSDTIHRLKSDAYSGSDIDTIFENITEELLSRNYTAKVFFADNLYCCIINGDKIEESVLETALDSARAAISFYFEISSTTAIGSICTGIEDISDSFENAKRVLSVMQMFGTKTHMSYAEMSDSNMYIKKDMQIQSKLTRSLKDNDPDGAYKILSEAIDQSVQLFNTSKLIEQYVFYILSVLSNALKSLATDDEKEVIYEYNDPFVSLIPFSNISSLKQKINDYLHRVCLLIQEKNTTQSTESLIRSYIDQNYSNYELSASIIAEQFGMSQSSLSQLFKKAYNIGMSEYIVNKRIDKAKSLLSSSDIHLEQIAQDVGYINIRSFFRAFKRIEGISPRQYQKEKSNN